MSPEQQLEVLNHAMKQVAGTKFIVAGFIKALNSASQFAFPICVSQILTYIEDPASGSFGTAMMWTFILAFCSFAKAILENLCACRIDGVFKNLLRQTDDTPLKVKLTSPLPPPQHLRLPLGIQDWLAAPERTVLGGLPKVAPPLDGGHADQDRRRTRQPDADRLLQG